METDPNPLAATVLAALVEVIDTRRRRFCSGSGVELAAATGIAPRGQDLAKNSSKRGLRDVVAVIKVVTTHSS
jgi:hypothetical protein